MSLDKDELFAKTKSILADLFEIDEAEVKPESLLYEELDIDSIDAVDLLIELKKHTSVQVRPEQFKDAKTLQDVVDIVAECQ